MLLSENKDILGNTLKTFLEQRMERHQHVQQQPPLFLFCNIITFFLNYITPISKIMTIILKLIPVDLFVHFPQK